MDIQRKTPKRRPTKIEEMSKEQIRQAIIKKRECNAKAKQIVENLLEKGLNEDVFLQCLPEINQSHFEDIIEERAIIHLCGYPLCCKPLSERDIPKQKYRISMKTNKVYDITARKSFCSNSCYKSAMYVKKQMLTSPLWFREYETVPEFKLLPSDSVGSLGQEVDISLTVNINTNVKQEIFTSINDFAEASLHEMDDDNGGGNENYSKGLQSESRQEVVNNVSECNAEEKVVNDNETAKSNTTQTNTKVVIKSETKSNNPTNEQIKAVKEQQIKPTPNPLSIVGEIIEKPERKIDPIITNKPETPTRQGSKKILQKKQHPVTAITIQVEKCLAEWFTIDTLLFLFGEGKVKEMVADKGECIKKYLNNYAKGIFYSSNTYDQYQVLCRKLNKLELEDRKHDTQTLQRETKPLPDYSILQEESKQIQLKVKAFYSGETQIPEVSTEKEDEIKNEDDKVTNLPLVDKNAQNALRRRIVCQHLNKVLPDLLRSLDLLTLSINSDVRLLVNTFKLKADNIMFKPIQWTLIAIVIIKLLSLRDKRLAYMLEAQMAFKHMQLLLLSYKQDGGYLDRLILWLTDVDRLLNTNDTQLTIE